VEPRARANRLGALSEEVRSSSRVRWMLKGILAALRSCPVSCAPAPATGSPTLLQDKTTIGQQRTKKSLMLLGDGIGRGTARLGMVSRVPTCPGGRNRLRPCLEFFHPSGVSRNDFGSPRQAVPFFQFESGAFPTKYRRLAATFRDRSPISAKVPRQIR